MIPEIPDYLLSNVPIREQLAEWQAAHGNPLTEILAPPDTGGIRGLASGNFRVSPEQVEDRVDSETMPLGDDVDLEFVPPGILYSPGDLVELISSGSEPVLAVYVQDIGLTQAQFITIRGNWVNMRKNNVHYTLPNFLSPMIIEPIIPYLPTEEVAEELLDQARHFDINPPRAVTGPIINALGKFWRQTEEAFRQNTSVLDRVHEILAHSTDLRFGTLNRIASKLLGKDEPSNPELFAVRRAILHAGIGFGSDERSHRQTGIYQIRSKEQVQHIHEVQDWLREFQEDRVRLQTTAEIGDDPPKLSKGFTIVQNFINKARIEIAKSRVSREPSHTGCAGPSKEKNRILSGAAFTPEEQQIILFVEYWCLRELFTRDSTLKAIAPMLIRATGMYEDHQLRVQTGSLFLQEIGVMNPYVNRVLFDVNLLLPTSQHSKPLEKMASKLATLTKEGVNLKDTMSDLRHDWKDLPAFCIDDAGALEIDDAISIERIPGSSDEHWIHVHIANPTAYVTEESIFSKMAAHLTETFYAPEVTYPLLPNWMPRDMFSLQNDRPCLTFSAKVSLTGEISETKVQPGLLRNVVSLTYDHLADILGSATRKKAVQLVVGGELPSLSPPPPPPLKESEIADLKLLHTLSLGRYEHRRKQGGVYFDLPHPKPTVYRAPGVPGLPASPVPRRKKAMHMLNDPIIAVTTEPFRNYFDVSAAGTHEHLVREMMILAGEAAASWMWARSMPMIYRGILRTMSQAAMDRHEAEVIQPAVAANGVLPLKLGLEYMQMYGRGMLSLHPIKHYSLGIDRYAKVTSPLRRYADMMAHWQIEAVLREEARVGKSLAGVGAEDIDKVVPFHRAALEPIISRLQPRERLISRARVSCDKHWITQLEFRAWMHGELDLPRRFNVIVRSALPEQIALGQMLDNSLEVIIRENTTGDAFELTDIWEVELYSVDTHKRNVEVTPIRLIQRNGFSTS
ncbi:RNB-domain-containing protein [Trichodelitschia bisporula]|uniref:RNB-domain-containing protein n=1 Tax=Trichodelitschia bisporula TaxID=703511 RepID=A0A6G1I886_9PEZI|nr:RNB-domain-containing protein [Trichodelitschia bisporula]